jgi:hypothetical protein
MALATAGDEQAYTQAVSANIAGFVLLHVSYLQLMKGGWQSFMSWQIAILLMAYSCRCMSWGAFCGNAASVIVTATLQIFSTPQHAASAAALQPTSTIKVGYATRFLSFLPLAGALTLRTGSGRTSSYPSQSSYPCSGRELCGTAQSSTPRALLQCRSCCRSLNTMAS